MPDELSLGGTRSLSKGERYTESEVEGVVGIYSQVVPQIHYDSWKRKRWGSVLGYVSILGSPSGTT